MNEENSQKMTNRDCRMVFLHADENKAEKIDETKYSCLPSASTICSVPSTSNKKSNYESRHKRFSFPAASARSETSVNMPSGFTFGSEYFSSHDESLATSLTDVNSYPVITAIAKRNPNRNESKISQNGAFHNRNGEVLKQKSVINTVELSEDERYLKARARIFFDDSPSGNTFSEFTQEITSPQSQKEYRS